MHQALQHPLLLALSGTPPDAPTSPRPMTPPMSPRPSTPTSPCPGTPLLGLPGVPSLTSTPQSFRKSESTNKVRQSTDTLPKLPVKMSSMRVTSQEGVALRAKINAKRPRSKSINGLSGIPGIQDDDDYADAFFPFDPDKPARFSFLEDDLPDGTKKKKPFYFVLEAEEEAKKSKTLDSGYDDIETYIPGTPEDREKTLELAKQGIIYSTVERKKKQKVNQQLAKTGNYECPADIVPTSKSSLVRVDSRKRIVKEMFAPIAAGENNAPEHTYGKLQHSSSNAHVYGRLVPNKITSSRELLEDNGYDQIIRTEPTSGSDLHITTHEAEIHTDNIYDQLDRKNEDIVVDSSGQLQWKDSKRGLVYDRVQRQDSFAPTNKIKPKIRDRDYHYDHVERKDGIFTALPPDITVSMEDVDMVHIPDIKENVYDHLQGIQNSEHKLKPRPRRDFGSKLLNKFRFGVQRNSAPPKPRNVTYADFWLDFSLKKKVEDYLRATNSLPRDLGPDLDGGSNRGTPSISGSPFGSMDIVIEDEENWVTVDSGKTADGYESVIDPVKEAPSQEETQQEEDDLNHDKEVNIHDQLQKRYSKIQEHMQKKFQLNGPGMPALNTREDSSYAELRSVRKQHSLQIKRALPPSPEEQQHYDQFNRADKAIRCHARSKSDTAVLSNDAAGYQHINKTGTLENSNGYDHLDRNYGGSRQDLADECSDDGYGHLNHNNSKIDCDITTTGLQNAMSIATEDGWVIVSQGNEDEKIYSSESVYSVKTTGGSNRKSHQYSNTSMYEEIWPVQKEKK